MLLKQNIIGFRELFKNLKVAETTILFTILGSGYFIASKILGISQAKEYGMDVESVGILFAVGFALSAISSQLFPKISNWLGTKNLLILIVLIELGTFFAARFVGVTLGTILIISRLSTSTTFWNIRSSILNPLIESKNRATSLSTFALLYQLPYAILAYTIGGFIDNSSPNQFAFILGAAIVMLLVIQQTIFYFLRPYKVS